MNPSQPEREPTREELLAMAYVDGELDPAARREFEALLPGRSDLAREVVQFQRLALLAREVAPPEPMDFEWRRLAQDPLHRAGSGLGFFLLSAGALGLLGWGSVALFTSELELVTKALIFALLLGATLLFVATLRARLRTLPFDPYTEIQR
jgi:anti-sigma factor RsiW